LSFLHGWHKTPSGSVLFYGGFVLFLAVGNLTIVANARVGVLALHWALLNHLVLHDNLRRQLAAIDDWQHTLPNPEIQEMPAREVTVNGGQGVYFSRDDKSSGILVWRQDNSWRVINKGLPLENALQAATEVK